MTEKKPISIYKNPSANSYVYPDLAKDLGIRAVFIKDESNRLGLPAFKILGASWGTVRAITSLANIPLQDAKSKTITLKDISEAAQRLNVTLFAATEGNHGRAVARMGKLLSVRTRIFVQEFMHPETAAKIANEGAEVIRVKGDYDVAVSEADKAQQSTPGGILIQDNAFENYEEIPSWIVEGYSTMFHEIEEQLESAGSQASVIVTPIGVGSLGHAVVTYAKSSHHNTGISNKIKVLAIEPETAACLHHNLRAAKWGTIPTSATIMAGMQCGTVSPISWPVLQAGVDASVTVSDLESHREVLFLRDQGIDAGPCGAGTLAGLRKVAREDPTAIGLDQDSVVVLLNTEGARTYSIPRNV